MSYTATLRIAIAMGMIATALAGCATPAPPPAPPPPVIVKVTANTYCQVMLRVYGKAGPTWSKFDTPESREGLRRSAAAFAGAKCVPASPRNPTS